MVGCLSDHGESLGEYNLFLHGTPYLLAPDRQKHVAMLAWFSDNYQKSFSLDTHCLQLSREKTVEPGQSVSFTARFAASRQPGLPAGHGPFAGCRGAVIDGVLAKE